MIKFYLIKLIKKNSIKLKILFFASLFFPVFSFAQTGPCYTFSHSTGNTYTSLSTDTIPLNVDVNSGYTYRDEGLSASIPIGFTFVYNFQPYDSFKVCTNGFVTLDKDYIGMRNLIKTIWIVQQES